MVDANVYISALVFGGVPQKVLELIQSKGLKIYVCQPIMDEVSEVLPRKFNWSRHELDRFLPALWERCTVITPQVRVSVCQDPDDNRILECAQESGAAYIVTGDDHLLRLKRFAVRQSCPQGLSVMRFGSESRPLDVSHANRLAESAANANR